MPTLRLLLIVMVTAAALPARPLAQAVAPAPPQTSFAPSDRLPFDAAVITGTLPNGLQYYVRRNTRPEKRVLLQLAVKAGSVGEAGDPHGAARERLHVVRRDGLHVSAADRQAGRRRPWAAGTRGFRRRHDARSHGDR